MTVVEFWVEQYQTVVAENKALGDKLRETLDENKKLQQQLDKLKDRLTYSALKNMDMENGRLKESLEGARSINSTITRKLSSSMHQAQELKTQLEGTKERLEKSIADRSELQADRDIWFRKNGEKQAEIEELKKKIQSLEDDLKSKACSRDAWRTEAERLRKELTESYSNGYSDGNEEGQNELWEMLQLVKDIQPNEFDTECECIGDVIDMDLEDFKEAYGKWEAKKKDVEYMRSYLKKYCIGKLCFGCPLYNTSEPVSSCLFSKLTDEEIEKKYRKVVNSEREKTPTPISSRLPQPWECTFEGTIEINEDILKVVCGIKDDKK